MSYFSNTFYMQRIILQKSICRFTQGQPLDTGKGGAVLFLVSLDPVMSSSADGGCTLKSVWLTTRMCWHVLACIGTLVHLVVECRYVECA